MKRQKSSFVLIGAAVIGLAPLLGCSRSATVSDSPTTLTRPSSMTAGAVAGPTAAAVVSKQELVAAALDAMHGCSGGPYASACVSLNELLSACPDIANAAEIDRARVPASSPDLEMSMPSDAPLISYDLKYTPAPTEQSSPTPDGCPGPVELEDVTVHFSVDGRVYEVVLRSPCLFGGEIYGGVDVPADAIVSVTQTDQPDAS